ncbi:hypothetical protein BDZ91DRAFT_795733 [Kalaharituber pfeilii]|nr:hypothetical protein BDZ91DRAFT_795733 [Kalaharituber pfeilii]
MTVPYIVSRKTTITKTKRRQRNERINDKVTDDEATDDEATDGKATDDKVTDEIAKNRKSPLTSIFGTDFVIPHSFFANYNP